MNLIREAKKKLICFRINFFFYLKRIILPEMIYTILLTLILYRLLLLLNRKLDQMDKRGVDSFV